MVAEQGIGEEGAADERQRGAHDASRRLEDQDDGNDSHHQVELRRIARPQDQIAFEDPVVKRQKEACAAEEPGCARQRSPMRTEAGEEGEGHQQQEADVDPPHYNA
ncbi:MAG: hypothetical protein M5R42_02220 [Rhodocyclaceae bacterium]|nr:hypothetical protein [Rhodocyclaceae bacterium]